MDNLENTRFSNTTDGTFGETKIDWEKYLLGTHASDTSSAIEATAIDFTSLSAVTFTES